MIRDLTACNFYIFVVVVPLKHVMMSMNVSRSSLWLHATDIIRETFDRVISALAS